MACPLLSDPVKQDNGSRAPEQNRDFLEKDPSGGWGADEQRKGPRTDSEGGNGCRAEEVEPLMDGDGPQDQGSALSTLSVDAQATSYGASEEPQETTMLPSRFVDETWRDHAAQATAEFVLQQQGLQGIRPRGWAAPASEAAVATGTPSPYPDEIEETVEQLIERRG